MWLKAPNIKCVHGFSNRYGGVSAPPFDSLNLGGSEDDPLLINENRRRALVNLGIEKFPVSNLKQVHGCVVNFGAVGAQTCDALVTDQKNLPLAVSVADCYPLLFHDPTNNIIGAAHAGWRGTVAKIAERTIDKMLELGADVNQIQVAIGQGISQHNFEVGDEVLAQFRKEFFPERIIAGKHIDLVAANEFVLLESGIDQKNIWKMNRCTFEPDFFSYRRDKGRTGRMWGLIML